MLIGIITKYHQEFKTGSIVTIGAVNETFKFEWNGYGQILGFFLIEDSCTCIHEGKLVFFEIKDNVSTPPYEAWHWSEYGTFWAKNIKDFDPNLDNIQFEMDMLKRIDYGDSILDLLFSQNPHLFEFIIKNKLYGKHWYYSLKGKLHNRIEEIKSLENLIATFNEIDIEEIINDYDINICQYSSGSRPGKDESVSLYMVSHRNYRKDDPYLNNFLIKIERPLITDSGYTISSNLGNWPDEVIDDYKKQALATKLEKIQIFKRDYSKQIHFDFLKQTYYEKLRNLKGNSYTHFAKNNIYF